MLLRKEAIQQGKLCLHADMRSLLAGTISIPAGYFITFLVSQKEFVCVLVWTCYGPAS